MKPKYQGLGETPGLKSNCRPGSPQRSAGGGRWQSWALLGLTSVSCQGRRESTWSLSSPHRRFPLRLVGTGRLGPDGRTSWLSQSLHAPRPHPLPWWLLDGGNYKRCPRRWCPTPRTSHLAREPWSPHQGGFHQLCTSLKVPVCWECLLMPMNDGWHCLASDDVRLSPDLTCSLGHMMSKFYSRFSTQVTCVGQTYGGTHS